MSNCAMCEDQSKKSRGGKPHQYLVKTDDSRQFKGAHPPGFEEQDYECLICKARFTHSTSRNDLSWTLWQG